MSIILFWSTPLNCIAEVFSTAPSFHELSLICNMKHISKPQSADFHMEGHFVQRHKM